MAKIEKELQQKHKSKFGWIQDLKDTPQATIDLMHQVAEPLDEQNLKLISSNQ